jgi:hypothetical protein
MSVEIQTSCYSEFQINYKTTTMKIKNKTTKKWFSVLESWFYLLCCILLYSLLHFLWIHNKHRCDVKILSHSACCLCYARHFLYHQQDETSVKEKNMWLNLALRFVSTTKRILLYFGYCYVCVIACCFITFIIHSFLFLLHTKKKYLLCLRTSEHDKFIFAQFLTALSKRECTKM